MIINRLKQKRLKAEHESSDTFNFAANLYNKKVQTQRNSSFIFLFRNQLTTF